MNAMIGWGLAVAGVILGWVQWGWQGVVLAVTLVVFWLLLQFSQALRVLRQASGAPVGTVASAVMLHAKMRRGMRLLDIVPLTRSLGQRVSPANESPEVFEWRDASGSTVRITLRNGRCTEWTLSRPENADAP